MNGKLKAGLKNLSVPALERFATKAGRATRLQGKVNVFVTSSGQLQEMNRFFLNKDKATDVLSFPALRDQTKRGFAGDIAISAEIAAEQACEFGHDYSDEVKILILHGMLHLAGYDHETDNGAMARREEQLRRTLGLPCSLIARARPGRPAAQARR